MPLSPDQLQKAWKNFKVFKDPDARAEIINHYSYLVKITAGRLVTSLPGGLDREDLVGSGVIGLIKSVDQFDPTRDVKFETYAIALIRGAILEMLRDEDWVPRSIREKLKALDRTMMSLETSLGRPATSHEVAESMAVSKEEVSELMVRMGRTNIYSLDDILGTSDGEEHVSFLELLSDEDSNTSGEVEGKEIRRISAPHRVASSAHGQGSMGSRKIAHDCGELCDRRGADDLRDVRRVQSRVYVVD